MAIKSGDSDAAGRKRQHGIHVESAQSLQRSRLGRFWTSRAPARYVCNASRSLIDLAHQANFLARQKAHLASKAKHLVLADGYISGLRPTPLLPIMHASGYRIQGCIYTEADERNKRQQGKSPTWARLRKWAGLGADSVAEPEHDMHFQSFLQRQREALARRDKRGHPREDSEVPISVWCNKSSMI